MKAWGIVLIAVLSVVTTRIAQRYLSYPQIALVLGAVILLVIFTNVAVSKWRSRNELKLATLLLSLDASQQQEELDNLPDESRQRIMRLMKQMASGRTRAHDARDR